MRIAPSNAVSRPHLIHGSLGPHQYRTNPFAVARGDKSAMRPFANLLWTLVIIACQCYTRVDRLRFTQLWNLFLYVDDVVAAPAKPDDRNGDISRSALTRCSLVGGQHRSTAHRVDSSTTAANDNSRSTRTLSVALNVPRAILLPAETDGTWPETTPILACNMDFTLQDAGWRSTTFYGCRRQGLLYFTAVIYFF